MECGALKNGIALFADSTVAPCCMYLEKSRKQLDTTKPLHLQFAEEAKQLELGLIPYGCSECMGLEQDGVSSYRSNFANFNKEANAIEFLDFRVSNLCNLSCRMCGPESSSKIAIMYNVTSLINQTADLLIDTLFESDLSNIKEIYFTGGEPLIMTQHWDLLNHLINLGLSRNISLRYNTNGTQVRYKGVAAMQLWAHFKNVRVVLSVDAIGETNSFLRSGSDWDTLEKNINALTGPKINLLVVPTVSALNVWHLSELLAYFNGCGIPVELSNILHTPEWYSLSVLPDKFAKLAIEIVKSLQGVKQEQIDNIVKQIDQQSAALFPQLLADIKGTDQKRHEDLWSKLPFKNV
jgi:sulfatase maturation enzyme AslB (radical SAM superfamily)